MKNLIAFELFEQSRIQDIDLYDKKIKYPIGLRYVNKAESIRSIRKLQNMLDENEIKIKDAIIAAHIISERAKYHPIHKKGIKDAAKVWSKFLTELKNK